MKKILLLSLLGVALLTACTSYYQVFQVSSKQNMNINDHEWVYQDKDLSISYNLWDNKGNMSFCFTNNTNQTMHVYLNESFLVRNGFVKDFRQLQIKSGDSPFSGDVVSIPPKAQRYFSCPNIQSETIEFFCEGEMTPNPTEIKAHTFNAESSPLNFGVRMTYSLGQNSEKMMASNDFYVNEIINYHKVNFEQSHYDTLHFCNEMELIPVQDIRSVNKFYIGY